MYHHAQVGGGFLFVFKCTQKAYYVEAICSLGDEFTESFLLITNTGGNGGDQVRNLHSRCPGSASLGLEPGILMEQVTKTHLLAYFNRRFCTILVSNWVYLLSACQDLDVPANCPDGFLLWFALPPLFFPGSSSTVDL